jgi:hypothetical protein
MRKELAPAGHWITAREGYNHKTPKSEYLLAERDLRVMVIHSFMGRGLVPLEALTTTQAGFDTPALHILVSIK